MADWIVGETAGTVSTVRVKYKRSRAWEQWALVTSDRHIDVRSLPGESARTTERCAAV